MAWRRVRELATGLTALALDPQTTKTRPVRRPARLVEEFAHGRCFYASTRELAAIWHLPQDAGRYGFPAAVVDHRAPAPMLPRLQARRSEGRRCCHGDSHRDAAHLRLVRDDSWDDDGWPVEDAHGRLIAGSYRGGDDDVA